MSTPVLLRVQLFAPAPTADKDESYGTASREQAFYVAVAMIERLGNNEIKQKLLQSI
jgi:hypothetical protein